MSHVKNSLVTAEQLAKLPDDGHRYQLIEGVLEMMSPAGGEHGRVTMNLAWLLTEHVKRLQLGVVFAAETGFLISRNPDTVRAPDVAFVSKLRAEQIDDLRGFINLAPDLVAEVVSPNDKNSIVASKTRAWIEAGVRLVLVVDPENRSIHAQFDDGRFLELSQNDVFDAHDVVPNWQLNLGDVFAF